MMLSLVTLVLHIVSEIVQYEEHNTMKLDCLYGQPFQLKQLEKKSVGNLWCAQPKLKYMSLC